MLSSWSGVPLKKIKTNKMSMQERKRVKKAYRRFKKHGKKNNCQFVSMSPDRGMTAQDIFRMTKPFGFPVVAIDYVGLLEGVDVDNQWQVLNAIIREAKIYSREAKCLVIILAQLDDVSDKLRYAKGMKEHVDVMWKWNYSKPEQRDTRTLPIIVDKARDGELFGFPLEEQFHIMRVVDMDDTGTDDLADLKGDDDEQEAQCS
jgi:replicative DNA helicase